MTRLASSVEIAPRLCSFDAGFPAAVSLGILVLRAGPGWAAPAEAAALPGTSCPRNVRPAVETVEVVVEGPIGEHIPLAIFWTLASGVIYAKKLRHQKSVFAVEKKFSQEKKSSYLEAPVQVGIEPRAKAQ